MSATLWAGQCQQKDYQHVGRGAQPDQPLQLMLFKLNDRGANPILVSLEIKLEVKLYVTLCIALNDLICLCNVLQQLVENTLIAVV